MHLPQIFGLSIEGFAPSLYTKLLPKERLKRRLRRYYRCSVLLEFLFNHKTKTARAEDTFMCTPGRYDVFSLKAKVNFIFQFWTKEFIEKLTRHLKENVASKDALILDAGAGNGALRHWLKRYGLNALAVDDRSWLQKLTRFPHRLALNVIPIPDWVLDMDICKAIKQYRPEIVICSWMPPQTDWTVYFRESESVKEYILIGEESKSRYDDKCGTPDSWQEYAGWQKNILWGLTDVSLSWLDIIPDCKGRKSIVVSYKRI